MDGIRSQTSSEASARHRPPPPSSVRVLGIDPGLHLAGYACVDLGSGDPEPTLVEAGVLRLRSKASLAYRLGQLHDDLEELLDELRPQRMAVEQVFSHPSYARTAILLGHARGVVLLAAQRRALAIDEIVPAAVKKSLTGNGRATKLQMQTAVMGQCGLAEPPDPPDVADAIAIALCGARRLLFSLPA
ncbi:MAG: crossover junction endodeoxyribonuclease RuvC [Phycisphaerales bacterium]|nr:crossover junction endodeoxyribonuclease RuvC [Phycisphaerales bacterium]